MASPKRVSGGETSRPVPIFSQAWRLPQQTLNEPNYTWHFPHGCQQPPCSFSSQAPVPGPEKGAWLAGQPQLVPAHLGFGFLVFKERGLG